MTHHYHNHDALTFRIAAINNKFKKKINFFFIYFFFVLNNNFHFNNRVCDQKKIKSIHVIAAADHVSIMFEKQIKLFS